MTSERYAEEHQSSTAVPPSPGGVQPSPPYAFYVVVIALSLAATVFVLVMLIFRGLFVEAAEVTTAVSSLFTVVGTVFGAYFGIKVSGDTIDKTRGAIERANDTANKALAALPPEEARQVVSSRPPGPPTHQDIPPT